MTVNEVLEHYDYVNIRKETTSRGEVFYGVEVRKYEPRAWGSGADENFQTAFVRALQNAARPLAKGK